MSWIDITPWFAVLATIDLAFPEMSVNFRSDRDERRETTFFQISLNHLCAV